MTILTFLSFSLTDPSAILTSPVPGPLSLYKSPLFHALFSIVPSPNPKARANGTSPLKRFISSGSLFKRTGSQREVSTRTQKSRRPHTMYLPASSTFDPYASLDRSGNFDGKSGKSGSGSQAGVNSGCATAPTMRKEVSCTKSLGAAGDRRGTTPGKSPSLKKMTPPREMPGHEGDDDDDDALAKTPAAEEKSAPLAADETLDDSTNRMVNGGGGGGGGHGSGQSTPSHRSMGSSTPELTPKWSGAGVIPNLRSVATPLEERLPHFTQVTRPDGSGLLLLLWL